MKKLNLYKLSKVADIRSVAFDNDYVQIIVRSKRSSIDYSIVNTYLPQSNNWEIFFAFLDCMAPMKCQVGFNSKLIIFSSASCK